MFQCTKFKRYVNCWILIVGFILKPTHSKISRREILIQKNTLGSRPLSYLYNTGGGNLSPLVSACGSRLLSNKTIHFYSRLPTPDTPFFLLALFSSTLLANLFITAPAIFIFGTPSQGRFLSLIQDCISCCLIYSLIWISNLAFTCGKHIIICCWAMTQICAEVFGVVFHQI